MLIDSFTSQEAIAHFQREVEHLSELRKFLQTRGKNESTPNLDRKIRVCQEALEALRPTKPDATCMMAFAKETVKPATCVVLGACRGNCLGREET